jgi:hypothetical protein
MGALKSSYRSDGGNGDAGAHGAWGLPSCALSYESPLKVFKTAGSCQSRIRRLR